jgi:hypothetical protein
MGAVRHAFSGRLLVARGLKCANEGVPGPNKPGILLGTDGNDTVCPMQIDNQRAKTSIYLLLLAIQIGGAISFVWQELPEFTQILVHPGEQLPKDPSSDLLMIGVFSTMQTAFWCRLLYVPIPFRRSNVFLNHLLLFLGRLSFIFGSALFSVVVFRHLPEMSRDTDTLLMVQRGTIFMGCLFALFCTSLEVERLARAFDNPRN